MGARTHSACVLSACFLLDSKYMSRSRLPGLVTKGDGSLCRAFATHCVCVWDNAAHGGVRVLRPGRSRPLVGPPKGGRRSLSGRLLLRCCLRRPGGPGPYSCRLLAFSLPCPWMPSGAAAPPTGASVPSGGRCVLCACGLRVVFGGPC